MKHDKIMESWKPTNNCSVGLKKISWTHFLFLQSASLILATFSSETLVCEDCPQ